MGSLGQPVPIFRCPGSTGNSLQQFTVAGAEADRLPRADRAAEQRLVLDDGRGRRLHSRPGPLGFGPAGVALARRSRRTIADLGARQPRLA